jgi:predicted dehydrogenase
MEKPFTETLLEADSVVAAAEKRGLKIVVAHNRRYTADFVRVKALLAEGFAGQVREVRIQGKQDSRVGGEDMVVLGTHDFDLLRFYFGDPLWCLGTVTQAGRDVTKQDARQGQEPIVVAGDTIRTHFAFSDGVYAHWSSVKTREGWSRPADRRDHWAFELLGTKRIVAYQSGAGFACLDSPYLLHPDNAARWQPLPEPKSATPEHQKHMARDLIHALETHSAPLCGAADGRWTLEMLTAVYQSHFARARVAFPLASRQNPLA